MPGELGGRGWSPEQVKRLTLREVLLYVSDEKDLGGVHTMSVAESKQYVDASSQSRPEKKVKWLDITARKAELYERHFGHGPPAELLEQWRIEAAERERKQRLLRR